VWRNGTVLRAVNEAGCCGAVQWLGTAGQVIAVHRSTLPGVLMLFVRSVLDREITAASAFRRAGLAMLLRSFAVQITLGRTHAPFTRP